MGKVASVLMKLVSGTKANAPVLFAGAAIVGVGITIFETAKATQLAIDDLRDKAAQLDFEDDADVWKGWDLQTKAKLTWKRFIPVILSGGLTIGCIFAGQYISIQRTAAVAALYAAAEDKLQRYQESTKEVVGERKEGEIRGVMAQKTVDSRPMDIDDVVITPNGHHLILDAYTGRYFRSDIETIRQRVNDVNRDLRTTMYASLADLYNALDLKTYKGDENVGWTCDTGIDIDFDAAVAENGEPCIVMDYCVGPRSDFHVGWTC